MINGKLKWPRISSRALSLVLAFTMVVPPGCQPSPKQNRESDAFSIKKAVVNPTNPEELKEALEVDSGWLLANAKIDRVAIKMDEAASYLGRTPERSQLAFDMLKQWVYLELYRGLRTEYFLINYAQALAGADVPDSVERFDRTFPAEFFSSLPRLAKRREELMYWLGTLRTQPQEAKSFRENLQGSIESAYIGLAYIDSRKALVSARLQTDADKRQEESLADGWRQSLYATNAILLTNALKGKVEPYYAKEVTPYLTAREGRVREFSNAFARHVEERRTLKSLAEYIEGPSTKKFMGDIADLLGGADQAKFRDRIRQALPEAAKEVVSNLESLIRSHKSDILVEDTESAIIAHRTGKPDQAKGFADWLGRIFEEQALHYLITQDHPYLEKSVDILTDLVAENRKNETNRNRLAFFALVSSAAVTGASFGWWKSAQFAIAGTALAIQAKFTAEFLFKGIWSIGNIRRVQLMARSAISGGALMNQIQEQVAWDSMWTNMRVAAAGGMAMGWTYLYNFGGFHQRLFQKPESASKPMDTMNDILDRATKTLQNKNMSIPQKFAAVSSEAGLVAKQMVVSIPGLILPPAQTFVGAIGNAVVNAITLGTVMGVLSVTMQPALNALGLQGFVWAFEKAGFAVPVFWKQNAISQDKRTARDQAANTQAEMVWAKDIIAMQHSAIVVSRMALRTPGIKPEEVAQAQAQEKMSQDAIKEVLKSTLGRWYHRTEFRRISNQILALSGFELKVEGSVEAPSRMTLVYSVGGATYAVTATSQEMESWLDQREDAPWRGGPPDLERMISSLSQ